MTENSNLIIHTCQRNHVHYGCWQEEFFGLASPCVSVQSVGEVEVFKYVVVVCQLMWFYPAVSIQKLPLLSGITICCCPC